MIRPMRLKCDKTQQVYFGMCHAGLGEYIIPIFSDEIITLEAHKRLAFSRTMKIEPSNELPEPVPQSRHYLLKEQFVCTMII